MANNRDGKEKVPMPVLGWLRLAAFGFIVFIFLGGLIFWATFGESVTRVLASPQWQRDFDEGVKQLRKGNLQAGAKAEKALEEARTAGASPILLVRMRRDMAGAYYRAGESARGHEEMEKAISSFPKECLGGKNSTDVVLLSQCYQDRAWEKHRQHIKDAGQPSGIFDQERALALAEGSWGPDSTEAAYKLSLLAVMNAETGNVAKADELMARTLKICEKPAVNAECGWYVGAMRVRMLASEGKRKEAVDTYFSVLPMAKDESQTKRIFTELCAGLNFGKKPKVEFASVQADLRNGKYAALDALAEKLAAGKQEVASGRWLMDNFYSTLASKGPGSRARDMSEQEYKERIGYLKNWMSKNPQSVAARLALADVYLKYAWLARGSGYANKVTDEGWKLFDERVSMAKDILDGDPAIKEKNPRAYAEYSTVALAQGMDKKEYLKMVDECHKRFPTYTNIDLSASYFLLPRWHGDEQDAQKYIVERADTIGGEAGDRAYAQMVWDVGDMLDLDDPFGEGSLLKWDRTKAGFKQIFKMFPDDMKAKIEFIELCEARGDTASLKGLF